MLFRLHSEMPAGIWFGFLKHIPTSVPLGLSLGLDPLSMAWEEPSALYHFHLEDRLWASARSLGTVVRLP